MIDNKILNSKYIYNTTIVGKDLECIKRQCFVYGYLDGFYDEEVYESNIEMCDLHKKYYNLGYQEGVNERLEIEDIAQFKLLKSEWIKKIADYDSINDVKVRKLSRNAKGLYENFLDGNE